MNRLTRKYCLTLIFALAILSFSCGHKWESTPKAVNGVLDLRNWDFEKDGAVRLDGEWEFYWKQFLSTKELAVNKNRHQSKLISVPGLWNDQLVEDEVIKATGYATYRLRIKLNEQNRHYGLKIIDAATAYRLTINDQLISFNGRVSKTEAGSVPQYLPQIASFNHISDKKDNNSYVDLIVQVANYSHQKGGLWESIYFGTFRQISNMRENKLIASFFIIGIIFIMAFYHFGLYFLRRKDLSPFFFALLCVLIGIRCLVTEERILVHWFPTINFELLNKLDYMSAYCNIALIAVFINILFKDKINQYIIYPLTGFGLLIGLVILVFPLSIFSQIKVVYDLYVLIGGLIVITLLFILSVKKVNGAVIALIGFSIMYGTGINDVLYNRQLINTSNLVSFGLAFYIISQSYLLSKLFSNAFGIIENLSGELSKLNYSYSRFVPHQFLSFLGHKSITEVKQGDHVQKEMTVFFSDIRSFSTLSESMTPSDNFNFLNSYLKRVSPLIREKEGFIDKFIGDAIMALFPQTADSALEASLSILQELQIYNKHRISSGYLPINIGIALHTGILMLGTIGEENRMDGTVISDAVNLASRMEGLTKVFGASIIVSEETMTKLVNPEKYNKRFLGNVHVKGKNQSVKIFEIFDGDSDDILQKKQKTIADYENGINHYINNKYNEAHASFTKVLQILPEDKASEFYMNKIEEQLTSQSLSEIDYD